MTTDGRRILSDDAITRALARRAPDQAPPDLLAQITRAAGGVVQPSSRRGSWPRVALLVAASLLLVVLIGGAIIIGSSLLRPNTTALIPPERGMFTSTGSPSPIPSHLLPAPADPVLGRNGSIAFHIGNAGRVLASRRYRARCLGGRPVAGRQPDRPGADDRYEQ